MAGPSTTIEARAYGPDSTPEEIEALRQRVRLHGDGVILFHEVPVATPFSVDVCYDRIEELVDAHGCTGMIVDVRESARPGAAVRKRINARIDGLEGRLRHIALVLDKNPLMVVAARFIQAIMPIPLSFNASIQEAEEALRSVVE